MDIQTGNILIAEFMGGTVTTLDTCANYGSMKIPDWALDKYDFKTLKLDEYQYATSFDWLMPVIEKIGKMYDKKECSQVFNLIPCSIFAPINVVWDYIIKFIQWYTTQPTKPNE